MLKVPTFVLVIVVRIKPLLTQIAEVVRGHMRLVSVVGDHLV